MEQTEELGIKIDDEVTELLKQAVTFAGNRRKLATQIGIGYTTLGNWLGSNDRKGKFITWEQWFLIRDYMKTAGLLDKSDLRWMSPNELRKCIDLLVNNYLTNDYKLLKSPITIHNINKNNTDAYLLSFVSSILDEDRKKHPPRETENPLSDEETSLIENYRLANDAGKIAIMATAQAQAAIAKREESKPGEKAE